MEAARDMLPVIKETAPDGLEMKMDFDQSVFVENSIESVLHEAVTGATLTGSEAQGAPRLVGPEYSVSSSRVAATT